LMASRLGVRLRVTRVAVRSLRKKRDFKVPPRSLTTDWRAVVNDPKVDLVVELIGGTTTAKDVVLTALRAGKPVVTANKALLAFHGEKLFSAAEKSGANLYYEASVAGGVPIIKVIREALVGNRVTHLYGILNGTCNFILTKMNEGMEFDAAVKLAQQQGYAEADPTLDVGGHDAAHKVGILASLAHGFWVKPKQVYTEGIEQVAPLDLEFADSLGYAIKLLGIVKTSKPGPVQVSMYPALIPDDHVLANVSDVYNGTEHDPRNIQAICAACHDAKTERDRAAATKYRADIKERDRLRNHVGENAADTFWTSKYALPTEEDALFMLDQRRRTTIARANRKIA